MALAAESSGPKHDPITVALYAIGSVSLREGPCNCYLACLLLLLLSMHRMAQLLLGMQTATQAERDTLMLNYVYLSLKGVLVSSEEWARPAYGQTKQPVNERPDKIRLWRSRYCTTHKEHRIPSIIIPLRYGWSPSKYVYV